MTSGVHSRFMSSVVLPALLLAVGWTANITFAKDVIIIRGATIIDGTSQPPRNNVDLVIQGKTFFKVEESTSKTPDNAPANAKVIDLKGMTIIPGIISAHSHVGQVDGVKQASENYNRDNILRQLRQYEQYGVTTVVALGTNQSLFYPIREEAHAGKIHGADLFGADRGIGVRNGVPSSKVLPSANQVDRPSNADEARSAVRAAKERGTDFIKIWLDDSRGTVPKMSAETFTAVIEEAHAQGLRVMAHIFNLVDAKALVDAGVDVIAHGVRDQPVDQQFIDAMKSKGVWYIATLSLDDAFFVFADHPEWLEDPFVKRALQPALLAQLQDAEWQEKTRASRASQLAREALKMNQRNLAILHDAGVKIGFGTDSGAMPLRIPGFMEHRELALMVEAGLSPLEAITIATGKTAQLLNLKDRGTLTAGQLADFIVLDKSPADEILNSRLIHNVWHRGELVSESISK